VRFEPVEAAAAALSRTESRPDGFPPSDLTAVLADLSARISSEALVSLFAMFDSEGIG